MTDDQKGKGDSAAAGKLPTAPAGKPDAPAKSAAKPAARTPAKSAAPRCPTCGKPTGGDVGPFCDACQGPALADPKGIHECARCRTVRLKVADDADKD